MNTTRKDILVPVDFKENFHKAVEYAKLLQKSIRGKIHLLHVLQAESWWQGFIDMEKMTAEALEKLKQVACKYTLDKTTVFHIANGKRYGEILQYADTIVPRYIVLTDNYPYSQTKILLGSTVSAVITEAKFPVVTLTEPVTTLFKDILVPLDLDKQCRLQLFNSVSMALAHNSKIHLVSVLFGSVRSENRRINAKIDKFKKLYEENSIPFTVKLLRKKDELAYKEIVRYGSEIKADSALVMTHSETVNFDNYVGAFAQQLINDFPIPVVTLNSTSAGYNYSSVYKALADPFGIFSKRSKL